MKLRDVLPNDHYKLEFVKAEDELVRATTKMMMNEYSQLPVFSNDNIVEGYISWKTIGYLKPFNKKSQLVADYMDKNILVLNDSDNLSSTFDRIINKEFALIESSIDSSYQIITTYDLAKHFKSQTEPYLELMFIETNLRSFIDQSISQENFVDFCNRRFPKAKISSVTEMTFYQYLEVLRDEDFWQEFKLEVHQEEFIANLDKVRKVRNDVMHFKLIGSQNKGKSKQLSDISKFFRFLNKMNE